MRLAKDSLDVALFTDRDDVPLFWQDDVGLSLDHVLPIRRGHTQHRFDLDGSVLKINVVEHGLPTAGRSTISDVSVADAVRCGTTRTDPDGNSIRFVDPATQDQIEVRFAVADLRRTMRHYTEALQWDRLDDDAVRCGRTTLRFEASPATEPAPGLPCRGWAYLTVQIHDCDAEHAAVLAAGGAEGAPPITMGDVARFSMVRDPDGNWLELSQRASLTGPIRRDRL